MSHREQSRTLGKMIFRVVVCLVLILGGVPDRTGEQAQAYKEAFAAANTPSLTKLVRVGYGDALLYAGHE